MSAWAKQILNSSKRVAIPIMTHPGIEAIGKRVIDAVMDGNVHYEAIKSISDNYSTIACTVIMDLTVEAEAFGATVRMTDNEIPNITGRLVCDMDSIEQLSIPDLSQGRIPEYLKANSLAVNNVGKPVLSGCIGPFSLAGRLYDMSEIMMGIYIEPDAIQLLLRKCTDFIISYCRKLKAIGATGVVIAEPAAGLLSNDDCYAFSSVFIRSIVKAVQDESFSVILHNCGNKGQCTQAMLDTDAVALHFGNAVDMIEVLKSSPDDRLIMGNIDPVGVFKQASAETVYDVTLKLLESTSKYKNFVLSSGCDIPPMVSKENILAFYKALDDFNA